MRAGGLREQRRDGSGPGLDAPVDDPRGPTSPLVVRCAARLGGLQPLAPAEPPWRTTWTCRSPPSAALGFATIAKVVHASAAEDAHRLSDLIYVFVFKLNSLLS